MKYINIFHTEINLIITIPITDNSFALMYCDCIRYSLFSLHNLHRYSLHLLYIIIVFIKITHVVT